MAKKKVKYSIEEQLTVKRAIIEEFDFTERRVAQVWLDSFDVKPDYENPDHWDFLLYSKEKEIYINLKFFPRISIEPTHTTDHQLGVLNYEKGMPIETVLWYLHNILDARG
ncbi:MAG: hypothetical protein ACHQ1D_04410 [Nitrososphaerales archaeon]